MADPLRELLAFQEKVNRLLENALSRSEFGGPTAVGQWAPATNVMEDNETVIVETELPGVREEDIDIAVTDRAVRISGESRMGADLQAGNYQRIERSYGNFSIDCPLHTAIDRERVEASYRQGVLKVLLPKRDSSGSQQVKVRLKSQPA